MALKLAAVILSMGLVACILLAVRQQRVQAAHDLADVQRRVMEHDRTLWRLRAEIATRVTPERLEKLASKLGPNVPINAERFAELLREETEASRVASVDTH